MKKLFNKNNGMIAFMLVLAIAFLPIPGMIADSRATVTTPPDPVQYESYPPFLSASVPPLVMLVMGRNHKLYYEAYNDASDLNEDGVLDITYKPDEIDYYGYFDSFKYYAYNSSASPARFDPVGVTADKKAPSGNYWSGDFLNYLTMSRMDAMRKVLYGGYRVTDEDASGITVLERAYIPQDAHTWGKEYESVLRDGYDIRDYTPLDLPASGTRHLFASTSLTDPSNSSYAPLLRVLPDNSHRIWEWVAKEGPVADDSLEEIAGSWDIVPSSVSNGISNMTRTTYRHSGSHPDNHTQFDTFVATYAVPDNFNGSGPASTIDGSGNPYGVADNYLTIFEGTLNIPVDGTYTFAVDGDDAVEFIIDGGDGVFDGVDDTVVAGFYGGHARCDCNDHNGSIALTSGAHLFQFRHEDGGGGDYYYLRWNLSNSGSTITDYEVRVKVADAAVGVEANARQYPDGNYKPIGILQRYGESEKMYFGLLTGSYTKNTSGGVLRKAVGNINDEIVPNTGQFTPLNGIIRTIDTLRVVDYNYGSNSHNSNCGWIATRPIHEGECRMWGNPVGEMMYETLRYFSGAGSPTSDFTYSHANDNHGGTALALPKPGWSDPYDTYEHCAKPFMLVLSDINPTFDSDMLPGSYFGSMAAEVIGPSGNPALDVEAISDAIFANELSAGDVYIGQQAATYDGACTAKAMDGFGDIRGLCPEEPTKQGSYYAAAVSAYGWANDIHATAAETQRVRTYAVGLASPLPKIEIDIKGSIISLVPFGKSVANYGISPAADSFQPTNTIVDFFVQELGDFYGKFRINYEDVEQGADHDMDAIVIYEYQIVDAAGDPVDASNPEDADGVEVTLTSEYASGGIIQHLGYIVSGSTADGPYLVVRDEDTLEGDESGDVGNYYLNTPDPAYTASGHPGLPLTDSRIFRPSGAGTTSAKLLTNPLWYAAKWGAFEDENSNGIPDLTSEWDKDGDGSPDTYYYVVNPLKLEEQLNKSFASIGNQSASGTTASVLATNSEGEGYMLQAYFKPEVTLNNAEKVKWLGYMQSLWMDPFGNMREDSNGDKKLDLYNGSSGTSAGGADRIITFYYDEDAGKTKVRVYKNHHHYSEENGLNSDCTLDSACPDLENASNYDEINLEEITPIFEAGKKLWARSADSRTIFTSIDGTKTDFTTSKLSTLKPYLGVRDDTAWTYLDTDPTSPDQTSRASNLIEYIRGKDSAELPGNPNTRNRTFNPDTMSRTVDARVWKLGDIVNSTPTAISLPPNNIHIIYGDRSFQTYYENNLDRETVVYVGANDGMLHAFTSGISKGGEFDPPSDSTLTIGDELWAYIPGALLPHLKFLANPEYGHSYYVDLKPKIFDARIGDTSDANQGWRTLMLVGLNLGGREIGVEDDFGDGIETRVFNPTLSCLDITDPANPVLMWERSYPHLGMTTSFPGIVKVGGTRTESGGKYTWDAGNWYAAVGSGPTDYNGTSNQNAHIFIIDLKTGDIATSFDTQQANALMNSPVSYDKNLTFNVDGIYFGSMAGPASSQTGKVFKVNTRSGSSDVPDANPKNWTLSSIFDSPKPISAPVSLSRDKMDRLLVFFGTGRYGENNTFKADATQQYLFGIKDPYFNPDSSGYGDNAGSVELGIGDLFNASSVQVFDDLTVSGGGASNWGELIDKAREKEGWYRTLIMDGTNPSERSLSKPIILGGIAFFAGFLPDEDVCSFGGETSYYGLYYETGTGYCRHIFSDDPTNEVEIKITEKGSPSPSLGAHIGREKGLTMIVQQGTGEAKSISVPTTALPIKSHISGWRDLE